MTKLKKDIKNEEFKQFSSYAKKSDGKRCKISYGLLTILFDKFKDQGARMNFKEFYAINLTYRNKLAKKIQKSY